MRPYSRELRLASFIVQVKEQCRIRESGLEEEVQVLKGQVLDGQRHTATENIQLIQLHKENNLKAGKVSSLQAQVEGLEEELKRTKVTGIY